MDAAARNLYQHSNTIRYRINKIKELSSIEDDLTFKFISLLHWWLPFPEAAKTPKGFPGWGTNGGANPILAVCLFFGNR